MVKKSYNAFKMWGSYVGALILPVLGVFSAYTNITFEQYLSYLIIPIQYIPSKIYYRISACGLDHSSFLGGCFDADLIIAVVSAIITGFLIGWGIHSLIRKFMKGGK